MPDRAAGKQSDLPLAFDGKAAIGINNCLTPLHTTEICRLNFNRALSGPGFKPKSAGANTRSIPIIYVNMPTKKALA
jgi:hypothetical protein